MMAKPLQTWVDDPATFKIKSSNPNLPYFWVSKVAPSVSALAAASVRENAAGWPVDIINRASARRSSQAKLWIGPDGISLGEIPSLNLVPGGLAWIRKLFIPKPLYNGYFNWSSYNYSWSAFYTNYERAVRYLTGIPDLEAVSFSKVEGVAGSSLYDADVTNFLNYADAHVAAHPDEIVVGFMVGTRSAHNYTSELVARVICKRPLNCVGFNGIFYGTGGAGLEYSDGATPYGFYDLIYKMYVRGLSMNGGWLGLMKQYSIGHQYQGGIQNGINDMGDRANYSVSYNARENIVPTTTELKFPGTSIALNGPLELGLECHNVYHIGDPEFSTNLVLRGPVTKVGSDIVVGSAKFAMTWPGSQLVTLNPDMAEGDKAKLNDIIVTTAFEDTPSTVVARLEDLAIWAAAQDAGKDLGAEVMAEATADSPEITMAEALVKANAADRRLFHKIDSASSTGFNRPYRVEFVNTGGALGVTTYFTDDTADTTSATLDDAMYAIAAGCEVRDASGLGLVDPYTTLFGIDLATIISRAGDEKAKSDFDEKWVFHAIEPFASDLPLPTWTAQMLTQHVVHRKHMSNFALGGVMMGMNARKVLG